MKTEAILEWQNEEEGVIRFLEDGEPEITARFFATGEEEAEFQLQGIVFPEWIEKDDNIYRKTISKVRKCILESFRLLWDEGFEEVVLMEQKGTKLEEIIGSTDVVYKVYSEYMMKRRLKSQKPTTGGGQQLKLVEEGEGFLCENAGHTFLCRLLPYTTRVPEESCFYLYEVEVEEKERNRGIATACLTALFQMLATEGPITLYLQVGSYNEPAVHLYKKLGFEISEELCYYAEKE